MKDKPKLNKSWIDPRALAIVENLQVKNYPTFLVGGCVRDLLLGLTPKDFDIGTMARPNEVKKCVPRTYIIGKRFRLVLAKRGDDFFEIATFRRVIPENEKNETFPDEDNAYGNAEEDALRRDFTINGLFYDPFNEQLIDHCRGTEDLQERVIRMIGDPDVRLLEDPIRILRALRLAHKINFAIDPELRASIQKNAHTLKDAVLPRKREELLKFLRLADPSKAFIEAFDLGVLKIISPTLNKLFLDLQTRSAFLIKLKEIHECGVIKEDPTYLFACLVNAYVRAVIYTDPQKKITMKQLEAREDLKQFMRFELGMFNLEQEQTLKALRMQQNLFAVNEFKSADVKRRMSLLKNSSFPLALVFARMDNELYDKDWLYWMSEYEKALPKLILDESQRKRRPYRKK